jgi:phosphatidylglycerol---prolipoprotein diacylglyceryl transferase
MYPVLFRIGARAVPSYGFFLTLGFALALILALGLSRKQRLPGKEMAALILSGIAVSVVGGRIYGLIVQAARSPEAFLGDPWRFLTARGTGGAFYGGLLAGIFYALWYLHRFRLPVWRTADVLGTATALGYAVMKFGCWMAGCCFGRPSSLPWAMRFPGFPGPVHPTQLYESGLSLVNFIILYRLLGRKKFDGQVIALDAFINSASRFVVEYYRADPDRGYLIRGASPWSSLSVPQGICLVAIIAGAILYRRLARKAEAERSPG